MRARTIVVAFAILTGSLCAQAAPVTIQTVLATPPRGHQPPSADIVVEALHASLPRTTSTISVGSETSVDIPKGTWRVSAVGDGLWAGPHLVTLTDDAPQTIILRFFATGDVAFSPVTKAGAPPTRFKAEFRSVDGAVSGTTECDEAAGTIVCKVPAVRVDIRLSADGFVPHYLWAVDILSESPRRLGSTRFDRGASLSGYVQQHEAGATITIELRPDALASQTTNEEARTALRVFRAQPGRNGFFQFRGVPAGGYILSAKAGTARSQAERVTIFENVEAQLNERLVLKQPFELHVQVVPPVDPWGKQWIAELLRREKQLNRADLVAQSAVAETGDWTAAGLTPGEYLLRVQRRQGVWQTRAVHLDETTRLLVPVGIVPVTGHVTLAGKPLRAWVWFGGSAGDVAVPVKSDEDGRFRTILPRMESNVWPVVEVIAETPFVRANVRDVEVKSPLDGGDAEVRIDVAAGAIYGQLVGQNGVPVPEEAIVTMTRDDDRTFSLEVPTDSGGTFTLHGVQPGVVAFRARARGAESSVARVTVDKDQKEPAYVELQLHAHRLLKGTVLAPTGPVAGARLVAFPDDQSAVMAAAHVSNTAGKYEIPFNAVSDGVTFSVAAPGYAYRLFRVQVSAAPIDIFVEQLGGRLTLVTTFDGRSSLIPMLFHSGAYAAVLPGSSYWGHTAVLTADQLRLVIPFVEAGVYSLCWSSFAEARAFAGKQPPAERCTSGYLAPFGELRLQSPRPSPELGDAN